MSRTIYYDCSKGKHWFLPNGKEDVCVICLLSKSGFHNKKKTI
jgi:hypothetical protein